MSRSKASDVITCLFELTLTEVGPLSVKLVGAQLLWKWKKGKAPKDSGSSAKASIMADDVVANSRQTLVLPVSFKSRLSLVGDHFEKKDLACSIKYVRLRVLFSSMTILGECRHLVS